MRQSGTIGVEMCLLRPTEWETAPGRGMVARSAGEGGCISFYINHVQRANARVREGVREVESGWEILQVVEF